MTFREIRKIRLAQFFERCSRIKHFILEGTFMSLQDISQAMGDMVIEEYDVLHLQSFDPKIKLVTGTKNLNNN